MINRLQCSRNLKCSDAAFTQGREGRPCYFMELPCAYSFYNKKYTITVSFQNKKCQVFWQHNRQCSDCKFPSAQEKRMSNFAAADFKLSQAGCINKSKQWGHQAKNKITALIATPNPDISQLPLHLDLQTGSSVKPNLGYSSPLTSSQQWKVCWGLFNHIAHFDILL